MKSAHSYLITGIMVIVCHVFVGAHAVVSQELFIGIMSGTSLDHIDCALVDFSHDATKLVATWQSDIPLTLRQACLEVIETQACSMQRWAEIDTGLGHAFASAVKALLHSQPHLSIKAIGSHGQTLFHHPKPPHATTLQLGDPNIIATETGITTIADFRRRDMSVGGQGAPLVPAFHQHLFQTKDRNKVVLNLGGIANLSLLPGDQQPIKGFDCGPGNTLLDNWCWQHQGHAYDANGAWAAQGVVLEPLLRMMLADPYFKQPPPKSTGREYFNIKWLHQYLNRLSGTWRSVDVQRTLLELTVQSSKQAIIQALPKATEVILCGGGVNNSFLRQRLTEELAPIQVSTTAAYGIDPQWIEAMAFAWLARQTYQQLPGNLPSVTGARKPVILGGVYVGSNSKG